MHQLQSENADRMPCSRLGCIGFGRLGAKEGIVPFKGVEPARALHREA